MATRQYMIFNTSEIETIDFTQVCETSAETLRKSVDQTKTFVKWDSEEVPSCVEELTTKEGPYSHAEILEVLSGAEWTSTPDTSEIPSEPIVIGETSSPSASGEPV